MKRVGVYTSILLAIILTVMILSGCVVQDESNERQASNTIVDTAFSERAATTDNTDDEESPTAEEPIQDTVNTTPGTISEESPYDIDTANKHLEDDHYALITRIDVSDSAAGNAPESVSDMLALQSCDVFSSADYPASVDPASTQPFAGLSTGDISAVYVQHPLVGSVKLTESEIVSLVGTLQALKVNPDMVAVASMWAVSYDNAYRFYVVGTNGELWLLDARCSMYSITQPMAVLFGDELAVGFGSESRDAIGAVYNAIEARLNAGLPAEMAPFANLTDDEVASVEYFYHFKLDTLPANRVEVLLDLLREVTINPQAGTGELPELVGGDPNGPDGQDIQFRLIFSNGRTLTVGTRDGVVIGGIRYAESQSSVDSFYRSVFY